VKSFRLDPEEIVLGSVLRRALPSLLNAGDLRYDPDRSAVMNDLVFGEIMDAFGRPADTPAINYVERLYQAGDAVKVRTETITPASCIAVVGNRYAPPKVVGGLTNPMSCRPNGQITGGAVVHSLFGVNVIGFVNHQTSPEERVRIKVHGVMVDDRGRSLNLSVFRERLSAEATGPAPEPHLIVVAGHSTDAGKTTSAWALVSELQKRGFTVTMEKKTGTAACGDWLRCFADPHVGALQRYGDEIVFHPDRFPARDFVDAVGVASDVSVDVRNFVRTSVTHTCRFLARRRSDFHVIELADSIAHVSNVALLRSAYFRPRLRTLVYVSSPTHEAVGHFRAYLHRLGYHRSQVLLSGPLANEARYEMAREEIAVRLDLPICRSAIQNAERWIPDGSELADAVLDAPRR
jgi:hypothetical protein